MLGDFLINGQPGTTANVGDTIQLIVPGYSQVWLVQQQNGQQQYNDVYSVPSNPYQLRQQDVGYFQGSAYTVTADHKPGQLITSWTFTVHGAGWKPETILPSVTPPPPGAPPSGTPGSPLIPPDSGGYPQSAPPEQASTGLFGLDQSTLLLIGAGVLAYLLFKK